MKARVAGVGPGNPKLLTVEVENLIRTSQNILAFSRVAETFKGLGGNRIKTIKTRLDILDFLAYGEALILASGDPMFYGIVDYLQREGVEIVEVYPGVSSIQYMAAKTQISWQDAKLLSGHGRKVDLEKLGDEKVLVFLTDQNNSPSIISKELKRHGYSGFLYVGFNLSYPDELIFKTRIGKGIDDISTLAVVIAVLEG